MKTSVLITRELTNPSLDDKAMKDTLRIDVKDGHGGVAIILLKGCLDTHTYNELEQSLNNLFCRDIYKLVIDCSALDYLSSAGAGVIIAALGVARERAGNIVLVQPRALIKEVFDLLGLAQVFPVVGSVKAAENLLARNN